MMKRFIILCCMMLSLTANAQIFTNKRVVDKFDDVVENKNIKTIVQKTDSTFIIEEKGKVPEIYAILNFAEFNSMGDKDNLVNLIDNIYGYQECWSVVKNEDLLNYRKNYFACILETDEKKRNAAIKEMVDKYCYYITHRVVVTQFTHNYLSEYYWVQKGDNNGRTIYIKQ